MCIRDRAAAVLAMCACTHGAGILDHSSVSVLSACVAVWVRWRVLVANREATCCLRQRGTAGI
eukprot:15330518-Alexandrium_andersonii.AAC.1